MKKRELRGQRAPTRAPAPEELLGVASIEEVVLSGRNFLVKSSKDI